MKTLNIAPLIGKTFVKVENIDNECVRFTTADGSTVELKHTRSCCERVNLEDVVGDLSDLEGAVIVRAEETTSDEETSEWGEVSMWTFYNISSTKGSVTLRFCGTSNGYYSVGVSVYVNGEICWE